MLIVSRLRFIIPQSYKVAPCVDWNEIAIMICRGGETQGFPPPWTPRIIVNIWDTIPKFFLGRNMRICWSGRPKILADFTSGRKYKRLKKKG